MAYSLIWLADVLRAAGCAVVEQPNWKNRGNGDIGPVKGVLLHHTAGAKTGNAPSLALIEHGRPDLAGPLSHLVLGRDGTFYVVGAGRCNHAGVGSWQGITSGNSSFIGIEAENTGLADDPWPSFQMRAYMAGVAAILSHIGATFIMAAGHKEYALPKGRKIDPSFDMANFRKHVESIMVGMVSTIPTATATDPSHSMLHNGDHGESVRLLQEKIGVAIDGNFGPATEAAVKTFQKLSGLSPDGFVGPATWAKLL